MRRRNEEPALSKIGFRVTDEEQALIQARAEKAGKTLADFCRLRAMGRRVK